MTNKYFKKWFRNPTTLTEIKANSQQRYSIDEDLGIGFQLYRGKRSKKNIPNSWDDIQTTSQKTWKKKRKTKYYTVGDKGKKYSIDVKTRVDFYKLEDYFENNNIIYKSTQFGGRKVKTGFGDRMMYLDRQYHIIYWSKFEIDTKKIIAGPWRGM
jgi:hypothetical protein